MAVALCLVALGLLAGISAAARPDLVSAKQCADGIDNDRDGLIDLADPGCGSPNDNSESPDAAPTPTPKPKPTATPTATAEPTATATPTATAEPTATATAVPAPAVTATSAPTASPMAEAAPTAITPTTASRPIAQIVIRIAGRVIAQGTRVTILSVTAPKAATIVARCSGGCPVRLVKVVRTTRRTVRLHRFERTLRPGTVLVLRVRVSGHVGRYTRFTMRRAKRPARRDACLPARGTRPVPC